MKFDAVLFDMDGLLIDSMQYWIEHDHEWFAMFNSKVTPELIKFFTGKSMRQNIEWIKNEYHLEESVDELVAKRIAMTNSIYTEKCQLLPGVTKLVSSIHTSAVKQAIASGSSHDRIQTVVDRFDLADYFDALLSTDDVGFKGKPAPDVYLHVAKQMGVEPSRCVVVEDAENGLRSAQAAGMQCIAVPNPGWSPGDFSEANLLVESLEDPRVYEFIGI